MRERELRQHREEMCWLLMTLHLFTGKPIPKLHKSSMVNRG